MRRRGHRNAGSPCSAHHLLGLAFLRPLNGCGIRDSAVRCDCSRHGKFQFRGNVVYQRGQHQRERTSNRAGLGRQRDGDCYQRPGHDQVGYNLSHRAIGRVHHHFGCCYLQSGNCTRRWNLAVQRGRTWHGWLQFRGNLVHQRGDHQRERTSNRAGLGRQHDGDCYERSGCNQVGPSHHNRAVKHTANTAEQACSHGDGREYELFSGSRKHRRLA